LGKKENAVEEDKVSKWAAAVGGRSLTEQDVPKLLEVITYHYLWEEIGTALGLPKRLIEECRKARSDVLRLGSVFSEWMKSAGCEGCHYRQLKRSAE